jgi:hypothetical protein
MLKGGHWLPRENIDLSEVGLEYGTQEKGNQTFQVSTYI